MEVAGMEFLKGLAGFVGILILFILMAKLVVINSRFFGYFFEWLESPHWRSKGKK